MTRRNYRRTLVLVGLGIVGCGVSGNDLAGHENTPGPEVGKIASALSIDDWALEAELQADGCPNCAFEVTPAADLRRVLLLSIDGMHAVDLYKWVANNPPSNIGMLYLHGIDYPNATASTPSGGFPGILALTTGGSPRTTGVYDEDSYDRTLFPPSSDCSGAAGVEVIYDHTIVEDWSQLRSPIEEGNLPRRLNDLGQCVPVYPHEFLAAPTLFEVVQASGRRTYWADNHAGYEILSGPSGLGLSEFFSPSVSSPVANGGTLNGVNLAGSLSSCNSMNSVAGWSGAVEFATCLPAAQAYDDVKVQSLINKIEGFSADGSRLSAVPTVLGINFSALQVAQRLPVANAGYLNAGGDPGVLVEAALQHIDTSIGQILAALQTEHLIEQTLIVLTAKHGQAPVDRTKVRTEHDPVNPVDNPRTLVQMVDPSVGVETSFVNPNDNRKPVTGGHVQTRDSALVWLQDQNNVNVSDVTQLLSDPLIRSAMGASVRPSGSIFSSNIVSGSELALAFGDPQSSDPLAAARAPNMFVQPESGVLYTTIAGEPRKLADSGGGTQDDINVPLLISNSAIVQHVSIYQPVSTKQVAPTILKALKLDVNELTAAVSEGTNPLPGIVWGPGDYRGGSIFDATDYDSQTNTQIEGTPPYVAYFDGGSSFCFSNVFLTGVTAINITLASANSGGTFSIRVGGPNGTKLGNDVTVVSTGGWTLWTTITVPIPSTTGLQTLCFRGESGLGIANVSTIELVEACVPECTGATCGSDGCGGTCGTCGFNLFCDDPFAQCIVPPTKYSVVDTSLPDTIPATAYDVELGTATGSGGTSLTSLGANDYACYYGVDLTSVQKLVVTLATPTPGGVLTFHVDGPTGTQIGSYTVSWTGGASTWKSRQVSLSGSTSGSHALCIRGQNGTDIAAIQSIELSADPVVAKWEVEDVIPAVPPDNQLGTASNVGGFIENFDATDYVCYDDVDLSSVNSIIASVASANSGVFAARLGGPTGMNIATFGVSNTGGWATWQDVTSGITPVTGLQTLCFVGVSGSGIANLGSFTLSDEVVPADYVVGNVIPAVPPDAEQGTTTDPGNYISYYDSGDYVCYDNVDMTGVNSIVANIASSNSGGIVSVRLGSSTGTQVGIFTALHTGGWTSWTDVSVPITPSSGITTLCFVGTSGNGIANLSTFTLSANSVAVNYGLGGTIPATPVTSQQGVETTGNIISYFDSGDWFCYAGIDLTGVQTIRASAASGNTNGQLAVRLGSANGHQIGSRSNLSTGGFSTWANQDITISAVPGVHTLCFAGTSSTGIANFQSFSLLP